MLCIIFRIIDYILDNAFDDDSNEYFTIHRLDINNFRITGSNHIWNLVNIDGWKHLDATWDDPVTNTGEDILIHDYFLITTKELKKADEVEHQFNKDIYIEANE